jgi:hypothetical protein
MEFRIQHNTETLLELEKRVRTTQDNISSKLEELTSRWENEFQTEIYNLYDALDDMAYILKDIVVEIATEQGFGIGAEVTYTWAATGAT